jgi:hypothetical protein
MKLRKYLKQTGQTSIEYILMLSVSVSMGVAFFKKFEAYLISNPDSYVKSQMNLYTKIFMDPDLKFKRYRLPR